MYRKKLEEDIRCPLEYGMRLVGGKWKSRIICLIGNKGPMRFGELKTDLVNITDGVLASVLNELIQLEMLNKSEAEEKAGRSWYSLTEKGAALIPHLREMCRWSVPYFRQNGGIVMGHCRSCSLYCGWKQNEEGENPPPDTEA